MCCTSNNVSFVQNQQIIIRFQNCCKAVRLPRFAETPFPGADASCVPAKMFEVSTDTNKNGHIS
jgi:hypothetical protein